MKAIVRDSHGSPDVLELRDIGKPVVGITTCCYAFTRLASTRASGTS